MYKSGFISIVGCPNVGKSTLMNAMIGQKVSIVSSKPQTTRNRIQGVLTQKDRQIIFIDTPGIHNPKNRLGEYMMKEADRALFEIDAILMLVDGKLGIKSRDREILDRLKKMNTPVVVVINKIDLMERDALAPMIASLQSEEWIDHIVPVSAHTGEGVQHLMELLFSYLQEGVQYFPDDMITDQPERLLIAEFLREKTLAHLHEEVPHGIGVDIDRMQEMENGVMEIFATIYCEKSSHKGIIIGKNGSMLKEISRGARKEMEFLLDQKVFLQVWVKVKEGWRNSNNTMKMLGYEE